MNETAQPKPAVLLLDDCPFTRRALSVAIEKSFPNCEVTCVKTLAEAQVAGAEPEGTKIFIIDSKLPDGSGIDFLADMMMVHNDSHFILLADGPLPDHLGDYRWLDQVQILRKAVDRGHLIEMMREMLGRKAPEETGPRDPSRSWKKLSSIRLQDRSIEDLVHHKIDEGATTVLEIVSRGESGQLHFINGRVMYAEAGKLEGKDALSKIMNWKGGFAFEVQKEPKVKAAPIEPEPAPAPGPEQCVEAEPAPEKSARGRWLDWLGKTAASLARTIQNNRNQTDLLTEATKP